MSRNDQPYRATTDEQMKDPFWWLSRLDF